MKYMYKIISISAILVLCMVFNANVFGQCCSNCPQELPDGATGTFSVFITDDPNTPEDECAAPLGDVAMTFNHQYTGDLVITLTNPSGTTITLIDGSGGNDGSYDITISDGGTGVCCNDVPASGNGTTYDPVNAEVTSYMPFSGTIASLNTADNCGEWIFTVQDVLFSDSGDFIDFGFTNNVGAAYPCSDEAPPIVCDADPGTVTTNAQFICGLGQGDDKLIVNTNNDFETAPLDPCGLAGTPGVSYLVYSGTPNGGDPCTDPNFTGAALGSGPAAADPGCLLQNLEYSYGGPPACAGPIGWGEVAGVPNSNVNTTFLVCPLYLFDEATSLVSVDYDCGAAEDMCGPVVGTDCQEFIVLAPITYETSSVCNADGTATVTISNIMGGYPGYVAATGMDPLADPDFTVGGTYTASPDGNVTTDPLTGGSENSNTPTLNAGTAPPVATVVDGGTITLTDVGGPVLFTLTGANGCSTDLIVNWEIPTIDITACTNKTCATDNSDGTVCPTNINLVDCINATIPPTYQFMLDVPSDGFPGETSWTIENSAGTVVANGGAGTGLLSGPLDPNDTYCVSFQDNFGDGWSCGDAPGTGVSNATIPWIYTVGDWDSGACGSGAGIPNGDGLNFGCFPIGSPLVGPVGIGVISSTTGTIVDNLDNTADFNATASGAGTHIINVDYTDIASGCVIHAETQIVVCANPADPVVAGGCAGGGSGITPDAQADADDFLYFGPSATAPTDVTTGAAGNGATFAPPGPGTYWVVAVTTDATSGVSCYSCPVQVDILEGAADPTPVNGTTCELIQGSISATGDATCATINWFSDVAGTTQVFTGASYQPADTAPGVYTYYAQCVSADDCASALVAVTYTIFGNPIPAFTCPASADQCGGNIALNPADTNAATLAASTGAWTGSGAVAVSGGANPGDPAEFDPTGFPVGATVDLIYTLTSADGCTNEISCSFVITSTKSANAGGFTCPPAP